MLLLTTVHRDIILQDPIATYNPVELSTLAHAVPQIDFPAYFASFAVRRFPGSTVILTYPPFVAELGDILRNTSRETLEAYLTVRVALHYAQYLAPETDAWQAWKTLDETLRGLKKGAVPERGEWCLEQVEHQLGYSVGRFFVQEKFGGDSRTKAIQVIKGTSTPAVKMLILKFAQTSFSRSKTRSSISNGWTRNPPAARPRRLMRLMSRLDTHCTPTRRATGPSRRTTLRFTCATGRSLRTY